MLLLPLDANIYYPIPIAEFLYYSLSSPIGPAFKYFLFILSPIVMLWFLSLSCYYWDMLCDDWIVLFDYLEQFPADYIDACSFRPEVITCYVV